MLLHCFTHGLFSVFVPIWSDPICGVIIYFCFLFSYFIQMRSHMVAGIVYKNRFVFLVCRLLFILWRCFVFYIFVAFSYCQMNLNNVKLHMRWRKTGSYHQKSYYVLLNVFVDGCNCSCSLLHQIQSNSPLWNVQQSLCAAHPYIHNCSILISKIQKKNGSFRFDV